MPFGKSICGGGWPEKVVVSFNDSLPEASQRRTWPMGADVVVMLPDARGQLKVASAFPPGDVIEKADLGAAQWCFEHGRSAGRGADTLPGAPRLFLPLRTSRGVVGAVGLGAGRRPDILLTPDERRLLDALMDQTAVAIERVRLAKDMDDARVAAEAERLRGALLISMGHLMTGKMSRTSARAAATNAKSESCVEKT